MEDTARLPLSQRTAATLNKIKLKSLLIHTAGCGSVEKSLDSIHCLVFFFCFIIFFINNAALKVRSIFT